jgi:molybdopterin-containing oxidoreductase family iron-sulfur binding subunit
MDRRQFIKITGLSTLFGLGGKGAFELLRPGALDASVHGGEEHAAEKPKKVEKRWAMVIDVEKCAQPGVVDKVIKACHSVHNVPDFGDSKNQVKWIWEDDYEHAFTATYNEYMDDRIKQLPFLCLCNHCDNPPCVRVCPTKATFRRPDGIVAMDYHRCIGCRFCMAACPFGARSFNWLDAREGLNEKDLNMEYPIRMRGVVEKCNFCVERLAKGQMPACVEAAPEALFFGDLADPNSNVRQILRKRTSMRRKIELGSRPSVFYLV